MKRKNFSLIELLIVIVILGVLTAIVLPQFNISEAEGKEAMGAHNAVGIERTIRQFHNIHGVYPSGWHTGLADDSSRSVAGLSLEVALNMSADPTAAGAITRSWRGTYTVNNPRTPNTLTNDMARALKENGIHLLSHNGFGYDKDGDGDDTNDFESSFSQNVATGCSAWILASTAGEDLFTGGSYDGTDYALGTTEVTINGRKLSSYSNDGGMGQGAIVCVFVTSHIQWGGSRSAYYSSSPDQPGILQGTAKVGMEIPPRDPAAGEESECPYYIAVFALAPYMIGSDSGWSCKFLGVLDQNLKPVNE